MPACMPSMQAQPVSTRQRHRAAACLAQGQAAAHDAAPDDASRHTVGVMDPEPPASARSMERTLRMRRCGIARHQPCDVKRRPLLSPPKGGEAPPEGGRRSLPLRGGKEFAFLISIALHDIALVCCAVLCCGVLCWAVLCRCKKKLENVSLVNSDKNEQEL